MAEEIGTGVLNRNRLLNGGSMKEAARNAMLV